MTSSLTWTTKTVEAETGIVAISLPEGFQVHDSGKQRMGEIEEFLNSIPDLDTRITLWRTLQDELDWLGNIRRNRRDDHVFIGHDQAPLSLGFWMMPSGYAGGLIFHGHGVGGGTFPTLAVTMGNSTGWQTHT
jgi:hypothetical protein